MIRATGIRIRINDARTKTSWKNKIPFSHHVYVYLFYMFFAIFFFLRIFVFFFFINRYCSLVVISHEYYTHNMYRVPTHICRCFTQCVSTTCYVCKILPINFISKVWVWLWVSYRFCCDCGMYEWTFLVETREKKVERKKKLPSQNW